MNHRIAAIVAVLFVSGSVFAQTDPNDSTKPGSGILGAPYARYEPETGIAVGIVGLYYFHLSDFEKDAPNRPSVVSAGATYTAKHQFSAGADYSFYFSHDNYYIFGGFDFERIPFDYFGIGDHTPNVRIDNFTPLWRGGDILLTRNIVRTAEGEGLNAGIGLEYRTEKILSTDSAGSPLAVQNIPGAHGGISPGIGVVANYDTRDNIFSTHEGHFAEFRTMTYTHALGGDYHFTRVTLDAREFLPVTATQTLAFQALLTFSGHEPFYSMAQLGGEDNMRGIFKGRYRDNDMAVLQSEYRFPVFWRFGLVGFADIGEVASEARQFNIPGIKWTAGGGLRFVFSEAEHVVVRLDYGISNDSSELYFFVNEAF